MAKTKRLLDVEERVAAPEIEWPGIRRSLEEVDQVSLGMAQNGLSRGSFFLGVVNLALTAFVLGRWPQHLWILYGIKCIFFIPAWFVEVSRRHSGGLWVLDYCWVMNICLGLYMQANLVWGPSFSPGLQRWAFLWFFAVSTGPLSWAVLALGNGLIFHSIERTATLFIHFTPCLVSWTMRWSPQAVISAWPHHFTEQSLEEASVGDIYLAGISTYLIWLVLHGTWLLTCGIHAPKQGYSTVFDGLYQKHNLGEQFRKATGLRSVRSHIVIYLVMHAIACSIAFTWSMLCYKYWVVHTGFGLMLLVAVVWNGAGYYIYIFQNVYSKALQSLLPNGRAQRDKAGGWQDLVSPGSPFASPGSLGSPGGPDGRCAHCGCHPAASRSRAASTAAPEWSVQP